jgi:hypothetical protein
MMTASTSETGSLILEVDAFMRVVDAFIRFMNAPMALVAASELVMNVPMRVVDSLVRVG